MSSTGTINHNNLIRWSFKQARLFLEPLGEKGSFEDRIADIFQQYDRESIVFQAIHQAQPFLALAVERTEKRLKEYGSTS